MSPKLKLIAAAQEMLEAGYSKTAIHLTISADVVDNQKQLEQTKVDIRHISIYVDIINGLSSAEIKDKHSLNSYARKPSILLARRKIKAMLSLKISMGEASNLDCSEDSLGYHALRPRCGCWPNNNSPQKCVYPRPQ